MTGSFRNPVGAGSLGGKIGLRSWRRRRCRGGCICQHVSLRVLRLATYKLRANAAAARQLFDGDGAGFAGTETSGLRWRHQHAM